MNTNLLVTIKKEKGFCLQHFEANFPKELKEYFIKKLKGYSIDVSNLKIFDDKSSHGFIEYTFSTNYCFYPDNTYARCENDFIYNEINKFKTYFNNRNKSKIKSIVIVS